MNKSLHKHFLTSLSKNKETIGNIIAISIDGPFKTWTDMNVYYKEDDKEEISSQPRCPFGRKVRYIMYEKSKEIPIEEEDTDA